MDELRAADPLTVAGVTLIPIEYSRIQSDLGSMGYWLTGFKEPFAVVICDQSGTCAFDMGSAELAVNELIQKVPNLYSILDRIESVGLD